MALKRIALVDFDHTLIDLDSLVFILKKERWMFDGYILLFGLMIVLTKFSKPSMRLAARSRFKRRLLHLTKMLPPDSISHYVKHFQSKRFDAVLSHIKDQAYDEVCVISAGERHLIQMTLEDAMPVDAIIANDWDALDPFVTCFGEEKKRRILQTYGNQHDLCFTVYTDSFDDLPMMELAQHTYLIHKDGVPLLLNDRSNNIEE